MYFDGAQVYSGNADVAGWAVDNGGLNGVRASTQSASWLDTVVKPGPNTDSATANIRWRVADGTAAKCAFLDAHVAVLKKAEVKRRHFVLY